MPAQNLDELANLSGFRVLDRVALRQKNGIATWQITDDMLSSWCIKRPELAEKLKNVVSKAQQIMRVVKMRAANSLPSLPIDKLNLRPYQLEFIENFNGINAGMFFEPGTGKTRTAIGAMMAQGASSAVIVAPGELVALQWADDIKKYWRQDVAVALDSTKKKIAAMQTGAKIIITNYHAFLEDEICQTIANLFPQWFVLDESHKIKNVAPLSKTKFAKGTLHKSIAKNILSLSHYIPRRLILTGTPITKVRNYESGDGERYAPQGISEDIFSQFYFLDHGETFGTNLYQFKIDWIEEFAVKQNRKYIPRNREKLEREFISLVKTKAMVVRAKDVLSLDEPNVIECEIPVDYNFEKRMKQIKDGMIIPDKNQEVYVLAVIRRMLQLCGGHDFGAETFHDFKVKKVLELIDESSEPITIFCAHLQEIAQLKSAIEKTGLLCSVISGEIDDKKTEKEKFLSGKTRVIIIQAKAGGLGLDGLQDVCSRIIYYNVDYGWAYYTQAIARILRSGQKNVVTIYRLICAGNYIDRAVYNSIDAQDDAIVKRFLERV